MPDAEPAVLSLRERKKLKTRLAIQHHAMRLFGERGYDATTIDQICAAAEVSPSTFFRYFPTKEDVAMYDATDPAIIAALARQPATMGPIAALRVALREAFADLPADEVERQLQRFELIRSVPELRARMLDEAVRTIDMTAALLAARVDLPADDLRVRCLAGAIIGVSMAALLAPGAHSPDGMVRQLDDALTLLEAGLPLL